MIYNLYIYFNYIYFDYLKTVSWVEWGYDTIYVPI